MLYKIIVFAFLFLLSGLALLLLAVGGLLRCFGLQRVLGLLASRMASRATAGRSAFRGGARQSGHGARQTGTPHGDVIIDRRNPEQAGRKIFDRSGGEYVDYREA